MVVDTLENSALYYPLGKNFEKAFEFLKNNDIRKMELGRHDIDGDDVFILVQEYESKTIDNCGLEAHKNYADVHYVAEGFEYIGYVPLSRAGEPVTEYDPKADAVFFEKECEFIPLLKGDIAIVFPQDVHMPQKRALVPTPVRKACIKVRVNG
ncbi:YhcH/YjgK/YiaL family protein [Ruminococcaceae bacterium OttesenSCG-928-A16]|nr:YhcH/YjgK/YiaL family protein [Ruminococcaceae bacterium OttesenSCG-928-A16]